MTGTTVERLVYAVVGLGAVAVIGLALMPRWRSAPTVLEKPPRRTTASFPAGAGAGDHHWNPQDRETYMWIPPGWFLMGCGGGEGACSPDEQPQHSVTISRGFWMGHTEVTVGAFRRFAQATGAAMAPAPRFPQYDIHPVVNVTWAEAVAYCGWVGGRLPTEAEWEYAAWGGTRATYYGYGELTSIAWCWYNSGGGTHPVGSLGPNRFGLYDMLGNVFEWVADWYDPAYYRASPWLPANPPGPPGGERRVVRGGSLYHGWWYLEVPRRFSRPPDAREGDLGFRCAIEAKP